METEVTKKFVELGGKKFKVVKAGLDEDEVASYIDQLMTERDLLLKRQESLTSLTKLYDKTIIEADNLAREIQKQAMEKAQQEANAVMMNAHEKAKDILERQIADAQNIIKQQVKTIKVSVSKQIDTALKEQIKDVQLRIGETVRELSDTLTAQSEKLANLGNSVHIDFEQTIPEKTPAAVCEAVVDTNRKEKTVSSTVLCNEAKDEKSIDIEILPPRDKDEIEAIEAYLKTIPEIKSIELLTMIDKSILNIKSAKQCDLMAILRASPQVYQAEECVKDGQKNIAVTLMAKARVDQENTSVNHRIMSMLSK